MLWNAKLLETLTFDETKFLVFKPGILHPLLVSVMRKGVQKQMHGIIDCRRFSGRYI